MGIYIPTSKRSRLLKYKYSSIDKSVTSKYILNPYWNWLVTLFPVTMAPNTITLLGLLCVFINFLTLLSYNPTLSCGQKPLHISKGGDWDPLFTPLSVSATGGGGVWGWLGLVPKPNPNSNCAPRWLYFTFSLGLFVYQSLDAIDGKQARRTGTSGPLGELFDHGCDALNTTLEVLLTASALNLGLGWWTVTSLVATNANFYLTTWEEFHTGTLYLSAFSGPVEGILLIVVAFAVTGFVGPNFWDQGVLTVTRLNKITFVNELGLKNLPLNDLFLLISSIGLLFNILSSTHNVYLSLPSPHSLSSIIRPLFRLSPYIVHTTSMIIWLFYSPTILNTTLLVPFISFWGITFAHHVGLLILSHLTASKFPSVYKHPLLVLSVLGAVDATGLVWQTLQGGGGKIMGCLAVAGLVYAHFVYEVVGDICEFYDINCLTIKHPKNLSKGGKVVPLSTPAKEVKDSDSASQCSNEKKKNGWGLKKKKS